MKVRIAENVLLVSPLFPGQALTGGQEVEVPDLSAQDWIRRGWARPVDPTPTPGPQGREVS